MGKIVIKMDDGFLSGGDWLHYFAFQHVKLTEGPATVGKNKYNLDEVQVKQYFVVV